MTEDIKISEEIDKLKSNITKIEEIVSKAKTVKEKKTSLLKEAKEDKLISKDELKRFSNDIDNFDKISNDKALIKKAKVKLIKLELETTLMNTPVYKTNIHKLILKLKNKSTNKWRL